MTQDNTPIDKENMPAEAGTPEIKAPKGRRGRKWIKIVGAMFVVLILLVLLLPTIASLGFVRSIVVGKINDDLNGKLEIDDWSLGWFSGTTLSGIRVFDAAGEKVASIAKVSTQLSLLNAIRGRYNLGKTDIDGVEFLVKLDKDGQANVAKVPKKKAPGAPKPEPGGEVSLPEVIADITINAKGTIEYPDQPAAHINSAKIVLNVPNLNEMLTQHADIETAVGNAPTGKIVMDGKLSAQSLLNIANKKAPGKTGAVDISWNVPNLQPLAIQLSGAMAMLPDVAVTGGEFSQATHVEIREKDIAVTNRLTFSAQGTRAGQPIKIDKVEVSKADAIFDPTRDSLAALSNLTIDIKSPFITVQGGGTPSTGMHIPGTIDLDKLREQLGQFFDLKETKLSGKLAFDISSVGDATASGKPIQTRAMLDGHDLAITIPGSGLIEIGRLRLDSSALVDLATNVLKTADVSLQTGDGNQSVIDMSISATEVNPSLASVGRFDQKLNVMNLATAQKQIDPFVPALAENGIRVTAGQLYTNVSGSMDGKTKTIKFDPANPFVLSTPNLTIQKTDEAGTATVLLKDEKITATVLGELSMPTAGITQAAIQKLSVDTQHKLFTIRKGEGGDATFKIDGTAITGKGAITLAADVKQLMDIVNRLGGVVEVAGGSPGQLTSGILNATVGLSAGASGETVIDLNGTIEKINVTTADPSKPIANEKVTLAIHGISKGRDTSASGTVDCSFANLKLNEVALKDNAIDRANVEAKVPDLAKAYALALAFKPPAVVVQTEPAAPGKKPKKGKPAPPASADQFAVTSGSLNFYLKAIRDTKARPGATLVEALSGAGMLDIPEVSAAGLEIKNLKLPLALNLGVLKTLDKSGDGPVEAASCSGGTFDLRNLIIDLNGDSPRLSIPDGKNRRIVHNVSINPVLGDTVGKYVNPIFANSKRSKGLLDVTLTECTKLALGAKLMTRDSGTLGVSFSITELEIVNPTLGALVGGVVKEVTRAIPKELFGLLGKGTKIPGLSDLEDGTFNGQIKDGTLNLLMGVATTDMKISLIDSAELSNEKLTTKKKQAKFNDAMALKFNGWIQLSDLQQHLNATIPPQLIAPYLRLIPIKNVDLGKMLVDAFPEGIPATVKGTSTKPEFDFGGIFEQFAKGAGKIDLGKMLMDEGLKNGFKLLK